MQEPIDAAIEDLRQWLKPSRKKKPIVNYDKNTKEISVRHFFRSDHSIRVKLRASREEWLVLRELSIDQFTFEAISPYLSRPTKENRASLESYAAAQPDHFASDCQRYIELANQENPLSKSRRKPRRGYSRDRRWPEIKATACHLFVFLEANYESSEKPTNIDRFKRLEEKYQIEIPGDRYGCIETTMAIIEKQFSFQIEHETDDRVLAFYNNILLSLPYRKLKNSPRIRRGDSAFLRKLLTI
jgi:hypothetical protein